jgi:4-hydroxy-tetrahydrodipicolinate synthase
MMRTPFTGCGTALVTPFTSSGAVDEAGVRRLARRQVEAGVHFLVPCGTTGEAPTLSAEEKRRVVELVVEEAAGRVPVLAGAGGYDTREVVRAAGAMHEAGADGLLSVTPYYNKPTPEGLFRHYEAIAGATPLPIVVYNVPGRTGCNVDPSTLARLASIPRVVGVKEASGNVTQICEALRAVGPDFLVLSGDDALTLPIMALGGDGVISVVSNLFPAAMVALTRAVARGKLQEARALHRALRPIFAAAFIDSNPMPVKSALAADALVHDVLRLPLVSLGGAHRDTVLAAMAAVRSTLVSMDLASRTPDPLD